MGRSSWTNKLLLRLKCGNLVEKPGISITLPHQNLKNVQDGNRHSGTQRHDHAPNTSQGSRHRSGAGTPSSAPKRVGNTPTTCRGVDNAVVDSAAHKRMAGESLLDAFSGSGFLAKTTNNLGLRWCAQHDVTKPLVLNRSRQDVSAGTCVAGVISPPRPHFELFQSYFRQYCHHKLVPSCSLAVDSGTPNVIRGCGTCRKSRLLRRSLTRPGPWQIFAILDHRAESEREQDSLAKCAGTSGRCSIFRTQTCSSKGFRISLRVLLLA